MATSAKERTRCVCGQFLRRRPDPESYADNERSYRDEYVDDHECSGPPRESLSDLERRVVLDALREGVRTVDVTELELVGPQEIASMLGVKVSTVWQWNYRKLLPAGVVVSGVPVWTWETIEKWARETGRLNKEEQQ